MKIAHLLAALAVCSGVALAQDPPDAPAATKVRIFTPFVPSGGPVIGLNVTGEVNGTCFAPSLADPARPDAWRCVDESEELHDPCFENPFGEGLACAESPFPADAVLLTLTDDLPEVGDGELDLNEMPWALELDNGQRCVVQTGSAPVIAGLRLNYACGDGTFVVGEVDRPQSLWRAFYWTDDRSLSLDAVGVVTAWY